MDRCPGGSGLSDTFVDGWLHSYLEADNAALLLQITRSNRRTLLLCLMSNNLALSDMKAKPPRIQDVVLVLWAGL